MYIVTKENEEIVWCGECFDELWEHAYNDGWCGDDIENAIENS
jgi:hypothetical protein